LLSEDVVVQVMDNVPNGEASAVSRRVLSASTSRLAIIGVLFAGIRIDLAQGTGDVVQVDREPPF